MTRASILQLKIFFSSGLPPYPLLKDLSSEELEYITRYKKNCAFWVGHFSELKSEYSKFSLKICFRWLDHYHIGSDTSNPKPIVGYLKEFLDQQLSGTSTFNLPDVPT